MEPHELVKTASDLIVHDPAVAATVAVISNAGGFMLKEAGEVAIGKLIGPAIDDMAKRFRDAQEKGDIPKDFESTNHGAALLQEALNALLEGLDEERAEVVKKVFLGLAKNTVKDSLARVQRLEIMKVASELTSWEVVLMNALERYRKLIFNKVLAHELRNAQTEQERQAIRPRAASECRSRPIQNWLRDEFCSGDTTQYISLMDAIDSLHKKRILAHPRSSPMEIAIDSVYLERGPMSDFGQKIAVHLYSASED